MRILTKISKSWGAEGLVIRNTVGLCFLFEVGHDHKLYIVNQTCLEVIQITSEETV